MSDLSEIKNHILRACAVHGSADLTTAISRNEYEILEDIERLVADRSDEDGPVKFRATLSIVVDLQKSVVETSFGYSVKRTVKESHEIPDPNQIVMTFGEEGKE